MRASEGHRAPRRRESREKPRPWRLLPRGAVLAIATLAGGCHTPSDPPPVQPNVVFIIADDLGAPYHGFLGDEVVRTPNIDRLAREGTVFTTGYVTASVCEPSLRTLLTGEEPVARRPGDRRRPAPLDERTLPGLLGRHGWASFQAGKFWAASFETAGFTGGTKGPDARGPETQRWMGGAEGLAIGRTTMEPVLDFIDENRDRPFFLWFAPALPHRPWDAGRPHRQRYAEERPPLHPETLAYYANTSRLDDAVGELVRHLDETGIRSRTLIVYLSDNGYGPRPEDRSPVPAWSGAKGTTADLGFRTPIVFNWPGHVPAGVVIDDVVSTLDVAPTVFSYAGVPAPGTWTGVDLVPAIEGGDVPRTEVIGKMQAVRIVDPATHRAGPKTEAYFLRDDRWHYVWSPATDTELLFDVARDPMETRNRAGDEPDVARSLRGRIEAWRDGAESGPRGDAERRLLPKPG